MTSETGPGVGTEPIASAERTRRWLWLFMAMMFLLVPLPVLWQIPKELAGGNPAILLVLVFPAAGGWMGWLAWKSFREWARVGPTPLYPDPAPGCAGGQVGGAIHLRHPPSAADEYRVTLQCVHVRVSGSGDSRRRSESVAWQNSQPALLEPDSSGARIRFLFDVPAELPPTSEKSRDYHLWRVQLQGRCLDEEELTRRFEVPVVRGTEQAREPLPESFRRETRTRERLRRLEEAQTQVRVSPVPGGVELYSAAGRNRKMALGLIIMGLVFGGAAAFLFTRDLVAVVMGIAFALLGGAMVLGGIVLLGRALRVRIAKGELEQIRYFAGRALWRRSGALHSADQLQLKKAGSMTQGQETVEFFHVEARVGDRTLRVAEGLRGRQLAGDFRDTLVQLAHLE